MKYVILNNTEFEMVNYSVLPERISFTIAKNDKTVEEIAAAAENNDTIVIKEDGETIATFNGYTDLLSTVFTRNALVHVDGTRKDIVCVEILSKTMQTQINALSRRIDDVVYDQTTLDNAIINIGEEINNIDTTITEHTEEFEESQGTQDAAIDDLANMIDEIVSENEEPEEPEE